VAAGANAVIVVPTEDEPDLVGLARLLATEIQPAVR
jgi:hypothetical protein